MGRQYAILRCEPGKWWRLEGKETLVRRMKAQIPSARVEPDGKACLSPLGKHHIFELLSILDGYGYSVMPAVGVGIVQGSANETYLLCSDSPSDKYVGLVQHAEPEDGEAHVEDVQYEGHDEQQQDQQWQQDALYQQDQDGQHQQQEEQEQQYEEGIDGATEDNEHGFDEVMAHLMEGRTAEVQEDEFVPPAVKAAPPQARRVAGLDPAISAATAQAAAQAVILQQAKAKGKGNIVAGLLARSAAAPPAHGRGNPVVSNVALAAALRSVAANAAAGKGKGRGHPMMPGPGFQRTRAGPY